MRHWLLLVILVVAGCAQVPEKPCPVCPPPPKPPGAERAQYVPASFDTLPGWKNAQLEPSLRAFMAGCPRVAGALLDACATATRIPVGDEAGARSFFESFFVPYALASAEGVGTGLITGYYEPILRGSRTKS